MQVDAPRHLRSITLVNAMSLHGLVHAHWTIPFSPGTQHRDHKLHPNLHCYCLCGNHTFLLGSDHLKIKVIFIDIHLRKAWRAGYRVKPCSLRASIGKVKLLLRILPGTQMVIGVINYNWTEEPDLGELRRGECYFGFLFQRTSKQVRWQKVDMKKVNFLENKETINYQLQVLHLMC